MTFGGVPIADYRTAAKTPPLEMDALVPGAIPQYEQLQATIFVSGSVEKLMKGEYTPEQIENFYAAYMVVRLTENAIADWHQKQGGRK